MKATLKFVASQVAILEGIKANIDQVAETLANTAERLQEHHDGKSEKWQESDAGEAMRDLISHLEVATESLQNYHVDEATDALGNIELP